MSEPRLPTGEEIAQLPRWARVAFAARCARRALPLFQTHQPRPRKSNLDAVAKAVSGAEQYAADADISVRADTFISASHEAVLAAIDVARMYAADQAGFAAAAAYDAVTTIGHNMSVGAAVVAAAAITSAAKAGVPISSIANDFATVLELSRRHGWTDDTPVPPEVFGPITSEGHGIEIEFEVPDHWTDEQIRDHVAELTHRAEMTHRAAGGNGLVVEEMRIEYPVPVNVPVGR